ncbi:MAG: aromatic hydrocarbon degradation protein [Deltaproteobacteria bacterium]|nr:aromatic hydrocarbon degradation protein [Deltaproteobacteria bacterium]
MKRFMMFAAFVLSLSFFFPFNAFATNGAQLIGVGATQKGMAGAVTAVPEDAITAISNPAGMATIGSRADFNGEFFMPRRQLDFTDLPVSPSAFAGPGEETGGGSELYALPALGWTAPAFNRDDVFFGGGFFATGGLGVDYDVIDAGGAFKDASVSSTFIFAKVQPAIAWNVNERLSVGAGVSIDWQLLDIQETFAAPSLGGINLDLGRAEGVYGLGANIGAIYKINDMITVGGSYTSRQYLPEMKYRIGDSDVKNLASGGYLASVESPGTVKLDLEFPQQFALGVAVTPLEALTLEFDVKWINWSATHDAVKLSGNFVRKNGLGTVIDHPSSIDLNFGWDDQWVFALGGRYAVNDALTVRAGYEYAKSPINEADVFNNVALPVTVEQHASLGASYNLGDHWGIAAAYMHAFKRDLSGKKDVPKAYQNLGFAATSKTRIQLVEDSIDLQLSYRF